MAKEEIKPSGGKGEGLKNAFLLVIFLGGIILILSTLAGLGNFLGINWFSSKATISHDVVYLYKNGTTTPANFYGENKISISDVVQVPASLNTYYAATSAGIYVSPDMGQNWYKVNLPKDINDLPVQRIFVNYAKPSEISFLISGDENSIIYKTNDNFYSVSQTFVISPDAMESSFNGRSISSAIISGDNIIIGTSK